MIREDRIELNNRFIRCFKMLEDKGVIVKNDRTGKGIGDVAERVLGRSAYGHIIRAYLTPESQRCIDYTQAKTFCKVYGISEAYLLEGIGDPFDVEMDRYAPVSPSLAPRGNILFTSAEAFAGGAVDVGQSATDSNQYFTVPGVSGGGLIAFTIKGNSMEPLITGGDIIICSEIQALGDIKENEIYSIKADGQLWVKHVQTIKERGRIVQLKLISANHLEHDPFVVDVDEFTKLYKVIRRLSEIN
jgi:hypothetical protein